MPQAASPEIVERFKEGYEWWNCGELDLMQEDYAEDAELDVSAVFTDMQPIRGRGSIRRYWDEMREAWEGMRMDPLQVYDVAQGRFVVDLRLWGKGKRSGAEIDQRFACLYTLRAADNKVVRFQLFPNLQDAMNFATDSTSAVPSG
jgi:ketosteroid isomerase-like protein